MGYSKRRTPAEWSRLVEAQRHGDQTIKSYCESHQLNVGTFYYWRSRLSEQEEQGSGFITLQPQQLCTGLLVLRFGSDISLELPADYPLEALSALIKRLGC